MKSKLWVRLICLILCLTVLLPCVSALAETTKVATYMLRLREKPSTSSKVLDAYPRGTKVTILKKGEEWTKVKVGGKTGYMQSDKLAYAKYKTKTEREVWWWIEQKQPFLILLQLRIHKIQSPIIQTRLHLLLMI